MEHDVNTGSKSTKPSLVSSNNKAQSASVNILSNIEGSKKTQQVQKPARSGLKMLLICTMLILGSGAIAYQLLNTEVAAPKVEISNAHEAESKPSPKAAAPAPNSQNVSPQNEDVAQIVNVVPPEHASTQTDKNNSEPKNLAEANLKADSAAKTDATPAVADTATPFDGLGEVSTHQTAQANQPQKAKPHAPEAKKSELKPASTASNQVASNASAAPAAQKETKPNVSVAKSEPVRETAKPKPKAKDHDVELIAAIISHEKVAPKSNNQPSTSSSTETTVTRSNKNSTLTSASSSVAKYQEGLEGLMAQCENLDFLEKMSCRHDACSGYWGKDPQCPTDEMAEKVLGRQSKY